MNFSLFYFPIKSTGPLNESIIYDGMQTKIYTDLNAKGEYVRLRDQFYLLDPVNERVEGSSFCHTLTDLTDFKLLGNGSLLILHHNEDYSIQGAAALSFNQFCVKKAARHNL
jgi:hypothetical protein